jgi:hypothetical protein
MTTTFLKSEGLWHVTPCPSSECFSTTRRRNPEVFSSTAVTAWNVASRLLLGLHVVWCCCACWFHLYRTCYMYRCVWGEFVGYGLGPPPPSAPLSYRQNFMHRVQLFWRSACALQFMWLTPAVHLLPPPNPNWPLPTVSFDRITLARIM